jgi:hypothetical protein
VSANLGTITRSDGGRQATYKWHPLYYFVPDSGPGNDQGSGQQQLRQPVVAPRPLRPRDNRRRGIARGASHRVLVAR